MDTHPAKKDTPLLVAGDNSSLRNQGSKYGGVNVSQVSERTAINKTGTAKINGDSAARMNNSALVSGGMSSNKNGHPSGLGVTVNNG